VTDYILSAFRTIITQHLGYHITNVTGDGNCFFRAVMKHLYPNITKDWEDRLSLMLRKRLNEGTEKRLAQVGRGQDYQYHGFVITDINDSVTMAKAGVWADNVQVCKLSEAFQCPVKVITFDDVGLKLGKDQLCPGTDYVIGSAHKQDPITLFFTPSPGHYEVLQSNSDTTTLQEKLESLLQILKMTVASELCRYVPAASVCDIYFMIEREGVCVKEIKKELDRLNPNDDLALAIRAELLDRANKLGAHISQFKAAMQQLGTTYLDSLPRTLQHWLHTEILAPLMEERGGPLAVILKLIA